MSNVVGRIEETQDLRQILNSDKAEFLALYGRRRIGKTYLVRQFFTESDAIVFNVTGEKGGTRKVQLAHFMKNVGDSFYRGAKLGTVKSWDEAFEELTKAMEMHPKEKKIILFFDELPWMATPKSRLLQGLDYYWNHYWSNDPRVKLIVCGSSASWILRKIINNKGGLHNRITHKIRLEPFTLAETKQFLNKLGVDLNDQQILLIYMATGGVPYYLSQVKSGLSAAQIIEKLAFAQNGILFNEFNNLFSSLFDNSEEHIQLIRIIASRRYGIGKNELLNAMGTAAMGGGGLQKLTELEEAGFITGFMPYHHKRQGVYYRVVDEYTLFYLKWIEPFKATLQKQGMPPGYWQSQQQTPEWHNWLGYAFEAVCYKHILQIRKALQMNPSAIADSWRYVPRKGSEDRGAQIDLLFDRLDDAITICEIKYTDKPFVLTKDYVEILQRKMKVFKEQTGAQKQLFMALISANGLKNNFYAEGLISGIVTLDDLFQ